MDTAEHPASLAQQIRAVRLDLDASQARFAELLRKAGAELGEPNGCTKRLVQKWESGEHTTCQPNYRRALEHVTGLPFSALCSPVPLGHARLRRRLDQIIDALTRLRADLE